MLPIVRTSLDLTRDLKISVVGCKPNKSFIFFMVILPTEGFMIWGVDIVISPVGTEPEFYQKIGIFYFMGAGTQIRSLPFS